MEHRLGHLPFTEKQVVTPTGQYILGLTSTRNCVEFPLFKGKHKDQCGEMGKEREARASQPLIHGSQCHTNQHHQPVRTHTTACGWRKTTTTDQGAPSDTTTRASIKRKLQQPLLNSLLTKPKQGIESPNHEHHSTNSDQPLVIKHEGSAKLDDNATSTGQPSVMSPIPFMPEKRILELVLDILQRQDTHEIFAEPVDPKEVEDYYEIIKEPMDFGTMRAKHHEGMYTNLEQFEHDVFLIPRNAMHFNSTGTIYFKQARLIYDLAKKVFHVLKTDFENFESEFSETRRRSSRRLQAEAKGLNFNSSPRFTTNVRSSGMTSDVSSKGRRCSLNGPSNLRRNIQGKPGFSRTQC
ncbi:hypothetical protein HYC85_023432 [Camellia sinensis]|uniref:Bromo domain-containing protein n=1 Tax=Camellia sinensis TaxID=4442 RepID=A0A7J7GEJ8_CAMSI|nr:hypothetical protein HYC85_023432 [Camellia sinensis]